MRSITSAVFLLTVFSVQLTRAQSPFFYGQLPLNADMEKYKTSGKMEQIGRTGVAAMHAVLLK